MPKTLAQILAEAAGKVWDAAKQYSQSQSEPYEGQSRAGSSSMQMQRDQRFASYVQQKASSPAPRGGDDWRAGKSQAELDWINSHPGAVNGGGGGKPVVVDQPEQNKLDWQRAAAYGQTKNEQAVRSSMRDLYSTRPGQTKDPRNFDDLPDVDPSIRQMASDDQTSLDYRIVTPDLIHHLSKRDSTLGQRLAQKYLDTPLDLDKDGYRSMFDLAYPAGFHTSDGKTLGADEFELYNAAIRQPKLMRPFVDTLGALGSFPKFVTTELGYARQQQRASAVAKSIDPTTLSLDGVMQADPEQLDYTRLPAYYRAQVDPSYATQHYEDERFLTDSARNVWGTRRVLVQDKLEPETDLTKDALYRTVVQRIKFNDDFLHRASEAYTPSMWINEALSLPSRAVETVASGLEGRPFDEKTARTNLTGTGYENSTLTGDELVGRIKTIEQMLGQPIAPELAQELPRGWSKELQDQFIEAARQNGLTPGEAYFKDGLTWNELGKTLDTLGVPQAKQLEIATSLGYQASTSAQTVREITGVTGARERVVSSIQVSNPDKRVTYEQVKNAGLSFMDANGEPVESAAAPDVIFDSAIRADLSRSRTNGFLDFVGDVLGDPTNYGPLTLVWKPLEYVMEGALGALKLGAKALGAAADVAVAGGAGIIKTGGKLVGKEVIKSIPEHAVTDTLRQLFTETVNSSALKFARRIFVSTANALRPEDMTGDGLLEFVNSRLPRIAEAARSGDLSRLLIDEKVPVTAAQSMMDSFRSAEKFLADISLDAGNGTAEEAAARAILNRAKASIRGASEETKNELERIVKGAIETGHYDDFVDAAYFIERELRRQANDAGHETAASVVERASRLMNEGQLAYGNAKLGVKQVVATDTATHLNKVADKFWGAWTNAVLTLRPGWQTVNYIDNMFRLLINGDLIDVTGKRGGLVLSSSSAEDILRSRYGLQRADIANAIKRYYGGSTEENIIHYLSGEGSFFDPAYQSAISALKNYYKATKKDGLKGLGSELWNTLKNIQPRVEGGAAIKAYTRAYISAFDEAYSKIAREIPANLIPSPEDILHRFDNVGWMNDGEKVIATQNLLNHRIALQREVQALTKNMVQNPAGFASVRDAVQTTLGDRLTAMRRFVDAAMPESMPPGDLTDSLREFIANYSGGVDFSVQQSRDNLLRLANDYIDAKLGTERVTQVAQRVVDNPPPMSEFAEREMINSTSTVPEQVVARAENMVDASLRAEPEIVDFAPDYKPRTKQQIERGITDVSYKRSDYLDTKNVAYTNALEDRFIHTNTKTLGYKPSRTDMMRQTLTKRIETATSEDERSAFTRALLDFDTWRESVKTRKPIPSGVGAWQEAGLKLPYRDYIRTLETTVGVPEGFAWQTEADVRRYLTQEFTTHPRILKNGQHADDLVAVERYAQARLQVLRMVDEGQVVDVMRPSESEFVKRPLTLADITNPQTRVKFKYTFGGKEIPFNDQRAYERGLSALASLEDDYIESGRTIFKMTHGTWKPVIDVNATGEQIVRLVPHDVMNSSASTPALNRISDQVEQLIDQINTRASVAQAVSPELDSLAAAIADAEHIPVDMTDYDEFVSASGAIGGAELPEITAKKLTDNKIVPAARSSAESVRSQLFGVIKENNLKITDQEAEDLYQWIVLTANANDLSSGLEIGTTLGNLAGITGQPWSGDAVFQKQNLDTPEFRKFFDGSRVTVSNGVSTDGMSRYKQLTGQWQNEDGTLYFVPNGSDERLRAGIRKSGDKYYVEGITRIDQEFDSLDDAKSAVLKENADLSGSIDNPNQPMVMYHGTPSAGFEAFDPSKLDPDGLYGPGIYMTDSPRTASGVFTGSGPDFSNGPSGYVGFRRVYSKEPIGEETARSIIKEMDDSIADTRAVVARGEQPAYDLDEQIKQRKAFNLSISKDSNSEDLNNLAIQFGDSPKQTGFDITLKSFAESSEQTGAAYPLYASIKNPFDIDAKYGKSEVASIIDRIADANPNVRRFRFEDIKSSMSYADEVSGQDIYRELMGVFPPSRGSLKAQANKALADAGYDGITHIGGSNTGNAPHRVFIAFDPGQVKSAIANRGTWDKTNPSMLLQQSGDFVLGFNQHIFDPSDIESARSLIGLLKGANADTAFEEWSHHLFKMQTGERKAVMYGWAKAPTDVASGEFLSHYDVTRELKELDDLALLDAGQQARQQWLRSIEPQARKADEDLTLAFRKYVLTGIAPNSKIKQVFDSVKRILSRTWQSLKTFGGIKITPELRKSFDQMLGEDTEFIASEAERLMKANAYILGQLPSDMDSIRALVGDTRATPEYLRAKLNATLNKITDLSGRYSGGQGVLTGEYDDATQLFAQALEQRAAELRSVLEYAKEHGVHPAKAYATPEIASARGLKPRLLDDVKAVDDLQKQIDKMQAITDPAYDYGRRVVLSNKLTSSIEVGGETVDVPLLRAVQQGDIPALVEAMRLHPEDTSTQYAALMGLRSFDPVTGISKITGEPLVVKDSLVELDNLLSDTLNMKRAQDMLSNINSAIKQAGGLKQLDWDKLAISDKLTKQDALADLENQLSSILDKYSARTGDLAGSNVSVDTLKQKLAEVESTLASGKSLREVVDGLQRDLADYTTRGGQGYPSMAEIDQAIQDELLKVNKQLPTGVLLQQTTSDPQPYGDGLTAWFDAMAAQAAKANPAASALGLLSAEQQRQIMNWLSDVGGQVARASQTAKEIAAQHVNDVLMDYDTTLGIDAFLTRGPMIQTGSLAGLEPMRIVGGFVPFAKFPRMNMMYMIEQLKNRPQMVRWYQRWQENINAERRAAGLPEQDFASVPVEAGGVSAELNPMSVFSAKSAINAVTGYIPDYFNPTERVLAQAKNLGFSVSPGLNAALRTLGVIRPESMPYFSLIPQGQLLGVIPGAQASVAESNPDLGALLGIISPGDGRGVVKQLGYSALSAIQSAPENLRQGIAAEYIKALESQSGPKWDTALSDYYETQAPAKALGYFTGVYPRTKTEQETQWQEYKNAVQNIYDTLDGIGALDDDTRMRLKRMVSVKPEDVGRAIVSSATPRDDSGQAIVPNMQNVLKSVDKLAAQYAYDEARAKILKDYFATHQVKVGLSQFDADWDMVQTKLAQLDADYAGKLDKYSFSPIGKKPAEVQAHLSANFMQLLDNSRPAYDGDYAAWQKATDLWKKNLPTIGRGIWEKLAPTIGLFGGETTMPNYLIEAATPEAMRKFDARFYTLDRALGEVWSKNYYDGYWSAVNGKTGKERLLAEREYNQRHGIPTDKQLYDWLQQDIFAGRFSLSDVKARVKELGGVASIKDKLLQGKDIKTQQASDLSDLLARIPPGRAWYKFIDTLSPEMQRHFNTYIDNGYTALENDQKWSDFYFSIAPALESAFSDPSDALIKEWISAEQLNKSLETTREQRWPGIGNLIKEYGAMSTEERASYRAIHPEVRLYYDWLYNQFAKDNPLWAKYYSSADTSSSSGQTLARTGYYGSRGTKRGWGGGGRYYSSNYSYRGSAQQPYYENAEQRTKWIEFRNTVGDILWGDLTNYWDNGGTINTQGSDLLKRLYGAYPFGAKNYEDWLNNVLPNLRSAMIPGHDIFKDYKYFNSQYQPNVSFSNNRYWFRDTQKSV